MQRKSVDVILFALSVFGFLLMSVSFVLMPLDLGGEGQRLLTLLPGTMFWCGLVIGLLFSVILMIKRRKWLKTDQAQHGQPSKKRIGLLSFFQNIPAGIADCLCAASIIGLTATLILTNSTGYVCYVFIALLVFTFCMHCILNGKIYDFAIGSCSLKRMAVFRKEK